jgi:hypothetical protein
MAVIRTHDAVIVVVVTEGEGHGFTWTQVGSSSGGVACKEATVYLECTEGGLGTHVKPEFARGEGAVGDVVQLDV